MLAALTAAAGLGCGPDKATYIERNEAVLSNVPAPDGVRIVRVTHTPYYEERGPFSNDPAGWTTTVSFQPPAGTTADEVIDFYIDAMPENWEGEVEELPVIDIGTGSHTGTRKVAVFTLGQARVTVDPSSLYDRPDGTFDITVDHKGVRP
jgi:hypothetical protein